MNIRILTQSDSLAWAQLRKELWPHETDAEHTSEIKRICDNPEMICFGAFENNRLVSLIELSLRNIVDGCLSSPVAYIEAWIVNQEHRGKGIGRAMMEKAKSWGKENKCIEMGSDTEISRSESIDIHLALGFEEVDRVVNFRLQLK